MLLSKLQNHKIMGIFIAGVNETVKNEIKIQEKGFIGMLLGNFGVSELGSLLTGKGVMSSRRE